MAPAPKALAEGTAPAIDVTHEVAQPAKAPEPYDIYVATAKDWELRPTSRINFEGNPEEYLDLQQTEIGVLKEESFVPLSQRTHADVLADLF